MAWSERQIQNWLFARKWRTFAFFYVLVLVMELVSPDLHVNPALAWYWVTFLLLVGAGLTVLYFGVVIWLGLKACGLIVTRATENGHARLGRIFGIGAQVIIGLGPLVALRLILGRPL